MKKKYFVIFKKDFNGFVGYSTDKTVIDLFKHQRDMRAYVIGEFTKKDVPKNVMNEIKKSFKELSMVNGFVITSNEEEYVISAKNEYIDEMKNTISSILKSFIPFIKLDKNEEKILLDFFKAIAEHLDNYEKFLFDNDDLDGELEYIDLEGITNKFIRSVIKEFI